MAAFQKNLWVLTLLPGCTSFSVCKILFMEEAFSVSEKLYISFNNFAAISVAPNIQLSVICIQD